MASIEHLAPQPAGAARRSRVMAVMPAYNAGSTLERTLADIPPGSVDEILLVDDASRDNTVELARRLGSRVLETVPFDRNSDDFVFDTQFLVQCVHFGFRLGDVPVSVRYFEEASSINMRRSATYAFQTLRTFVQWYGHRLGFRSRLFEPKEAAPAVAVKG